MYIYMTSVLEPIGAGLVVALINKFIINNSSLWQLCMSGRVEKQREDADDHVSSTSTTTVDTIEVHAHF